jgi:predicted HD superfamily hydrolase involved in NAD metabolism
MIYNKHYYKGEREELVATVQTAMSDYRFQHVLRVEQMALRLAEKYDVDAEAASVAALTHDYAKERSDEDFLSVIVTKHLDADLKNWGNEVWHGIVGAELVKDELGIQNQDILDAIRQHTTGSAYMTLLSQVLYMADYIETGRDFPRVAEVRDLTFESLSAGIAWQTTHTLSYLVEKGVRIYPGTLVTYNEWSTK